MNRTPILTLLLALSISAAALAQERRELSLDQVTSQPPVLAPSLPPVGWVPGSDVMWTRRGEGDDAAIATRAAGTAEWQPRFTLGELRAALLAGGAPETAKDSTPPWRWRDGESVRILLPDGIYHWTLDRDKAVRQLATPDEPTAAAVAAGDDRGAFVQQFDLYVQRRDGSSHRITEDGSADIVYGGAAHRSEFGIKDGLWWSADGRFLAFSREDQRPITPYPYVDVLSHPPAAAHGRYPYAGGPNSLVTIGVYDSKDDSLRYLENDPALDRYWTNVTFAPDGRTLYVALVERGQDKMQLVRFDTLSGAQQAVLFTEEDPEWIEPEHGPIFTPDGLGFLWFSPRDGYRHLYHYDLDGGLLGQVTSGATDVRSFVGFDGSGGALVMASGDNPLEMHLWATGADGKMTRVTDSRGWHDVALSDGARYVLDRYSHLELPGAVDLLDLGEHQLERIATADDPLAGFDVGERRFFSVDAADGTPLHGLLLLPPARFRDHRGPVLQYVYGGPHSQLVRDTWLGGANLWLQYMASRGFTVFVLDNRGTDNRGIEFSQSVFRRLGTLEVDDQRRALRHVLQLPFTDPARVGVHGWSYGGFMTLSLLLRAGDLYACGAAGAPVTDWAQYETGYTERYMDTPADNPEGYAGANLIDRAGALGSRLLLIQGTDDKTVMWSHSMRFLDAAISNGKLVDFFAYPMQQHGIRGPARAHLFHLLTRFLCEQLQPAAGE